MNFVRDSLGRDQVSERRACPVLGQPRSTQRRQRFIPSDEPRLIREMIELATQFWALWLSSRHSATSTAWLEGEP